MSCAIGVHNRTVTCFKVPSRGRFSNWICPLSRALQIVTQWGNFRWAFTIETRTLWLCFSSYISLIQFLNRLANWHANIKDWRLHRVQRLWLKATAFHRSDCKCTEKIAVWCFCCFVPVTPAARLWECHSLNILIVRPTDNPILQLICRSYPSLTFPLGWIGTRQLPACILPDYISQALLVFTDQGSR